jgi:hypothetical protein
MKPKKRDKSRRYGPPKRYPVRTMLLLEEGTLEKIDAVLDRHENRQRFIRAAIEERLKVFLSH